MIKRLLLLLAFFCGPSVWATTTVTGHLQTAGTTSVTVSAFVRFWLRGCAGNQPTVPGSGLIAPTQGGVYYFDMAADSSGNISGTLFSTRDSTGLLAGDIECGSSFTAVWYGMQIYVNGKSGPEIPIHAKSGVTLNINSVTPITVTPVVTAPTGDSTYLRLDAGNSPITGALSSTTTISDVGGTHSGTEKFTAPTQQTGVSTSTAITQQYPVNQAGLTSAYWDVTTPACTTGEILYAYSFAVHAETTNSYNGTTSSSTPCYDVAIFTNAIRSGSRTDWIWAMNPVIAYTNTGSAQGIEIDVNNEYQDYVIGGSDTSIYCAVCAVNGVGSGEFKSDRAFGVNGPFQRGLWFAGVVNRDIHFAGSPATYALYSDQSQNNYMNSGTWAWTDGADNALHRFTPFANNTNNELFGTNAANSSIVWSIDNQGDSTWLSVKAGGGSAMTSSGVGGTMAAVNQAQTWSGNQSSMTLVSPTINLLTNGTGLQMFETSTTCTTGASAGATCTTANIALPVAEADTSYRAICTPVGAASAGVPVIQAVNKIDSSHITITIVAITAVGASFPSYDCMVGHN